MLYKSIEGGKRIHRHSRSVKGKDIEVFEETTALAGVTTGEERNAQGGR